MKRTGIIRQLEVAFAVGGFAAFVSLAYFGLTSPAMPYSKANVYEVDRLIDVTRAGAIQPGDLILTFNGQPFYRCVYFVDSPIYSAPRGTPIPVEYERAATGARGVTSVVLADPSPRLLFNRSLTYLIAFSFVFTSVVILLGGTVNGSSLLVGLAGLSSGLVIAAGQDISDFQAPLSLFFWWGIPVWATLLVTAHAGWPINQLRRPAAWVLIGANGLVSLLHIIATTAGANWFGCRQGEAMLSLWPWAYILNIGLPLPSVLYLVGSAYRLSDNPFSRLQIRAIAWAVGLGLGTPLLLSLLPLFLGLPWIAPIEITLLVSGIIPITYLFVIYRGELLLVSRFLNRAVFTLLFFIFWGVVTLLIVNGLSYWIDNPDPILVAALAALPPLLAATVVRKRLGLLIDLALYGVHYDPEVVVSQIGLALARVLHEDGLAEVVTRQLTQALSIHHASLWLPVNGSLLRLVGHSALGEGVVRSKAIEQAELPQGEKQVEVLDTALRLGTDPTPWRAIVRLRVGDRLAGVVLLGEKIRESVYSDTDVRTLTTLAGWMATTVANIGYLTEQRLAAERERRLMLALVENEERLLADVAGELHDRGISALGMVRLMAEQERGKAIVTAGLERVIADLRELSNSRLSPMGLSQGLPQALEAMAKTQQQLGFPVGLHIEDSYHARATLSPLVSRELFFIAQEAVVNAVKHAQANQVVVSLSMPDGMVRLTVRDDGRGFDIEAALKRGETHGTGIMRARASRIGGTLTAKSEPDNGTEITVEVAISGEVGEG